MRILVTAAALLTACTASDPVATVPVSISAGEAASRARPTAPAGTRIEPSGYATILSAPPMPYPAAPPSVPGDQETDRIARENGISVSHAERMMNPDEPTRQAANALRRRIEQGARGNYVDVQVVRDPRPRHQFHFRENGPATLARFTRDPRFRAVNGGVPPAELQPVMATWMQRFAPERLASSGSANPFDGTIEIDIQVSRSQFEEIAAREGWQLPASLRLRFQPEIDPGRVVAADAAPFVRTFPRADRAPALILSVAQEGRILLHDGCFRLNTPDGPLVLFGRNTRLVRDAAGYLTSQSIDNPDERGRIGERMIWGGYPAAVEGEPGVQAIRTHCGPGPIESVGEPTSAAHFRVRPYAIASYARARGLPLQAAWDELKACWAEQDEQRGGAGDRPPMRNCDSVHPINSPPPPLPPPPPPRR